VLAFAAGTRTFTSIFFLVVVVAVNFLFFCLFILFVCLFYLSTCPSRTQCRCVFFLYYIADDGKDPRDSPTRRPFATESDGIHIKTVPLFSAI
jgi:hypothetical protein